MREPGGHVVWARSGRVSLSMTSVAFRWSALKPVAGVAGRTRQLCMRSGQAKVCELRMIELGALPLIHGVAGFAGHRQVGGNMIQRGRLLEIALMAADTRRAQSDKDTAGRANMAVVALQRGVSADKRKTVQMVADGIDIHLPAVNGVAVLACRAKLPPMDVSVAISALLTDVSKDFLHMARITCDILVKAAERILCFTVVVELHCLPKGRPTCCRMAVLAGDGERPVRIARLLRFPSLAWQHPPACHTQDKKYDRPSAYGFGGIPHWTCSTGLGQSHSAVSVQIESLPAEQTTTGCPAKCSQNQLGLRFEHARCQTQPGRVRQNAARPLLV